MKRYKYVLLLVICLVLLSSCGSKQQQYKKKIAPFTFTNQDGQAFSSEDLSGKIWIADFIFTNCKTICQPMTAEMANLQKVFKEKGIEVEFVSFTVDPEMDSPEILKSFVKDFTKDLSNWHQLTGYSQDEIETFARDQFQTIVQKPASSNQVIHSSNFYLINEQGLLINEYHFIDASYVDDIIKDINHLSR